MKIDQEARRETLNHIEMQIPLIQQEIKEAQADLTRLINLRKKLTEAEEDQ